MELYPLLPGESIELRLLDPAKPERVHSVFLPSWDALYEEAPRFELDWDVYFGVCPRVPDENGGLAGTTKNVPRCPVLWADLDPREGITKEDRLEQLREAPPSFLVDSGRGYHAYWKLKEDLPPRFAQRVMREMAAYFNCDDTGDPPRILRVPGTLNHKFVDRPGFVTLVQESGNGPWTPDALPRKALSETEFASGQGGLARRVQLIESHGLDKGPSTIDGEEFVGRDKGMYEVALYYHWKDWSDEDILNHLIDIDAKNRPPLGEAELRKKLRSARKSELPPHITEVEEVPNAQIPITQFTLQSMSAILDFQEPPTEWMAEGVLARGHIVYTTNPSKSGKTTIALNMALRMAAGKSGAGLFIERPFRTLFLQPMGDMHPTLTREWVKRIGSGLHLDSDIAFELGTLGERRDHFRHLNENASNYDLIVIDTMSRLFPNADEDATARVNEDIDKVRILRMNHPNTCWMYLLQVGKNSLQYLKSANPGFAVRGNTAIAEANDDSIQVIVPTNDIERDEVLGLNLTRHLVMMGRGASAYRRPWRTRFNPETHVIDWVQDLTYDEAVEAGSGEGTTHKPSQTRLAADLLGQLFLDAKEATGKPCVLASEVYCVGEDNGYSKRVMKLALDMRGGTIDPARGPKAAWWDAQIEVVE